MCKQEFGISNDTEIIKTKTPSGNLTKTYVNMMYKSDITGMLLQQYVLIDKNDFNEVLAETTVVKKSYKNKLLLYKVFGIKLSSLSKVVAFVNNQMINTSKLKCTKD